MNKTEMIFWINNNDKEHIINDCRKLVLEDIKSMQFVYDGQSNNVTPEEHYHNIVNWCKTNLQTKIWSCSKSCKINGSSYYFKHRCEEDLKSYVANNWLKMAMIDAGLEITKLGYDYEKEAYFKENIELSDIVTNSINFYCRTSRDNYSIYDSIKNYSHKICYSY